MNDQKTIDEAHAIVETLIGRRHRNALALQIPPIDLDQPNEHNSKKEFRLELEAVEMCLANAMATIEIFAPEKLPAEYEEMIKRLRSNLDAKAMKEVGSNSAKNMSDMAIKNMVEAGFTYVIVRALFELRTVLITRLQELHDQEIEFWSIKNRAPNYHARTIALRLARLYAQEKGRRPSYGTASDGDHPSTDFGRAVEAMFDLLGIRAKIRGPVEWAIEQLTDDDLKPIIPFGLADTMNYNVFAKSVSDNPAPSLENMMQKDGKG